MYPLWHPCFVDGSRKTALKIYSCAPSDHKNRNPKPQILTKIILKDIPYLYCFSFSKHLIEFIYLVSTGRDGHIQNAQVEVRK